MKQRFSEERIIAFVRETGDAVPLRVFPIMPREASAMPVRQNLGELLNQGQYRGDSIVVTRDGKPVAALVDSELHGRILRMREAFQRLTDELGRTHEGAEPSVADAEIAEAVDATRRRRDAR